MNKSIKRTVMLGIVALMMVMGTAMADSLAYFTTYVSARGGHTIDLSYETEIHEDLHDLTKGVTIENLKDTDVFVRVRVFHPTDLEVTITGDGWRQDGDYWYYDEVLKGHAKTTTLTVTVNNVDDIEGKGIESFNVVVVHESTRAIYNGEQADRNLSWNQEVAE